MSGQQHDPVALYPLERPGTHFTGGRVGPRAGLDRRCCQQTATKCSPQHHNLFPIFQVVSSFDVFQLKFCTTTCPAQLNFLAFKTVLPHYTLSGKQYALWTFSVFMFLHPPRSFLARPHLSSHSPSIYSLHLLSNNNFHTHTKNGLQTLLQLTNSTGRTTSSEAICQYKYCTSHNMHVKIPLKFIQDIFLPS